MKFIDAEVGISHHAADWADNEIVPPVEIRQVKQAAVIDDPAQ